MFWCACAYACMWPWCAYDRDIMMWVWSTDMLCDMLYLGDASEIERGCLCEDGLHSPAGREKEAAHNPSD